jgi:hypothetical protein
VALGSLGILTRAIVFLILGFAAYDANSHEALGLSGALRTLQAQPYGGVLLAFAGVGFIAFGGFEILEPMARRVHGICSHQFPRGQVESARMRRGYTYVAAVYFPPTTQTFNDVVVKFEHDLEYEFYDFDGGAWALVIRSIGGNRRRTRPPPVTAAAKARGAKLTFS